MSSSSQESGSPSAQGTVNYTEHEVLHEAVATVLADTDVFLNNHLDANKDVKVSEQELNNFVNDVVSTIAKSINLSPSELQEYKKTVSSNVAKIVESYMKDMSKAYKSGASSTTVPVIMRTYEELLYTEIYRGIAVVKQGIELPSLATQLLERKDKANIPPELLAVQSSELLDMYEKCLQNTLCPIRGDIVKTNESLVDQALEFLSAREEVLREIKNTENISGALPESDKFVMGIYSLVMKGALRGGLKNIDTTDTVRRLVIDAVTSLVHQPTKTKFLSHALSMVNDEEAKNAVLNSISTDIQSTLAKVDKTVHDLAQNKDILSTPSYVATYAMHLEHMVHSALYRNLGRYMNYSTFMNIEPPSLDSFKNSGSPRELVKRKARHYYYTVADPDLYIEGVPEYYEKLFSTMVWFMNKHKKLNAFLMNLARSPMFTGETSAVVKVGDSFVKVSYEYTPKDVLEYATMRSILRDKESVDKLVESFISLMENLQTVDSNGKAVSVKQYVEANGVKWEEFTERLRKGLKESVERYLDTISSGSGSALAKHIYFREMAKSSQNIYDYWLVRLSREFGVLMYEYQAELKFLENLEGKAGAIGNAISKVIPIQRLRNSLHNTSEVEDLNTTAYMRSALRLKASLKDLAHEHSELLRSSKLGDTVKTLEKNWGNKDHAEEVAANIIEDLRKRMVHRFVLEAPVILPDLYYENLKTIERDIVDREVMAMKRKIDLGRNDVDGKKEENLVHA